MSENFIRILIYTHATFGGISLLVGLVALIVTKGNNLHRSAGKIFYWCMLIGGLLAIIISVLPNHENSFLFSIGIFSCYMILSGKQILHLKKLFRGEKPAMKEFFLPTLMLVTGIGMMVYGIILLSKNDNHGIVLIVFSYIGSIMAIRDMQLFRKTPNDKKFWLYQHISKMSGGYIAAVTAFVVVNGILPGIYGWLLPSVIGTIYIVYHQSRFRKKGERILADRNIENG